MKFAHDFKDILASQDFPSHWVKQAIPYCQLKKCLKKIQRELQDLGLDSDTLRALLDHNNASPVALRYKLKAASDSSLVRPKLMVHIHVQDGVAVEAPLAPKSLRFFQRIATERDPCIPLSEPVSSYPRSHFALVYDLPDSEPTQRTDTLPMPASFLSGVACETIEIPLVFDSEFFDLLQGDVNNLDALQAEEVKKMAAEVVELGKEVSQVSQPTRFAKSDLASWRYIFELYLDAEVFFATNEHDHGARSSQRALEQLHWFQNEVDKRYLARNFKLGESKLAFSKFLKLNACLLKNLQFQEINRTAVFKILKKFDKRTSFGVSQAFPAVIQSDGLFSRNIAKDVCAQMSQDLVSVVPQLNDYLCPICCSVAYRPVRLSCKHVFCIRCVVKIQRFQEKHCPLCRADVVMDASADNLDHKLEKYMKRYFPKEVKEKQRANEIERGIEDYGPGYTHQQCSVM